MAACTLRVGPGSGGANSESAEAGGQAGRIPPFSVSAGESEAAGRARLTSDLDMAAGR